MVAVNDIGARCRRGHITVTVGAIDRTRIACPPVRVAWRVRVIMVPSVGVSVGVAVSVMPAMVAVMPSVTRVTMPVAKAETA